VRFGALPGISRPNLGERLKNLRNNAFGGNRTEESSEPASGGTPSADAELGPPPVPPPDNPDSVPSLTPPVPPAYAPPLTSSPPVELVPPKAPSQTPLPFKGPESSADAPKTRNVIVPKARGAAKGSGVLTSNQAPALRAETQGPDAIVIGKEADYVVRLVNDGAVAAEGVHVRIALPSWIQVVKAETKLGPAQPQDDGNGQQRLVWTADSIGAGGSDQMVLTVKPTDGRPFDIAVDWTVRPTSTVTQITVQRPELAVVMFGPKDMMYGKSANFTIQLTNPGTGDAEDVVLEFMYGQRHLEPKRIGRLAAGQQSEIEVELSAQEAGTLRVNAVATAAGNLKAEATEEMLVRRGRLVAELQGPPVEFAGTSANYKLRVANTGNAAASDVVVNVLLPRGAKPLAAADASERTEAGTTWKIGSMSPGSERVLEFSCELQMAGANRVEASVRDADGLEATQAFVTDVKALADLKLLVNDPPGPMPIGEQSAYEVRIVNRGTKAAEQVNVVAQFSDGIEPVEAVGGSASIVPGQVLFRPIPRVEPGAELTLRVVARASREGIHRFRAEVTCGDPDTKLVAEESTYYFDGKSIRTAKKP
jgi:hypothetical protein